MVDTTKDRIIDAAYAILSQNGIDSLTIEDVANHAGVSRKTVYNHFPGRYALIEGVCEIFTNRIMNKLEIIAQDNTRPFIKKLNDIVEYGYNSINDAGKIFTDHEKLLSIYSGYKIGFTGSFYGFIESIVTDAKHEGLIKNEYDERQVTFSIVNIVGGLTVLKGIEDEQFSKADILRLTLKAFVSGILSDKGIAAMKDSPILM